MIKLHRMDGTPWHEGEQALPHRAGAVELLAEIGPQIIRDHMPDQHRQFFAQLPMLLVGSLDAQGQPWASVLAGPAGFMESPDPRQLLVRSEPMPHDPLRANLVAGMQIGLLGIEPHTRRRNRVNGVVTRAGKEGFAVHVTQSFGNCPKYIQARRPEFSAERGTRPILHEGSQLDDEAIRMIRNADTFYIATAHPMAARSQAAAQGVDVSHRGGKPGFVRVDGRGTLTAPDFLGNSFFNTLGNIAVNPLAGLLFIDFDNGGLLHLAVRARIILDGPEVAAFAGALRLLRFEVASMRRVEAALPLRWSEAALSPQLLQTGSWNAAAIMPHDSAASLAPGA
jgi:predicted pyridoxine 5'-phosphate oxidase superfamily flavin-nucleotide-binding protein